MMHRTWRQDWRVLLGLFALVLPLVAGFAHHHDAGAGGNPHHHASLAGHAHDFPLASPGGHLETPEHGSHGNHHGHDHHEHDGDDGHVCSICLALATLRTAQPPGAIAVLPPSTAAVSGAPARATAAPPTHSWRAHGARAPPSGLHA